MKQKTLQASPESAIVIDTLAGDLRVAGWDRSEIMARTNGEKLDVESNENEFRISCDDDLILYLPRQAKLTIDKIAGDVGLQAMLSEVTRLLGEDTGDIRYELPLCELKQVLTDRIQPTAQAAGVRFELHCQAGGQLPNRDANLILNKNNVKAYPVSVDFFHLRNIGRPALQLQKINPQVTHIWDEILNISAGMQFKNASCPLNMVNDPFCWFKNHFFHHII